MTQFQMDFPEINKQQQHKKIPIHIHQSFDVMHCLLIECNKNCLLYTSDAADE